MISEQHPRAGRRDEIAVRRFVLVTLMLPACLVAAGLTVQSALPASGSIPVHQNCAGTAGGWACGWPPAILTLALALGLPVLIGLSCLPRLRRGERGPAYRVLGAQALGISMMQTILMTGVRVAGLGAGRAGGGRLWPLLALGLAAGLVSAVVGWRLQPGQAPDRAHGVDPLDLVRDERAVWMRTTCLPWPAVAPLIAALVIMSARVATSGLVQHRLGRAEFFAVIVLALLILLVTTATLRVSVGEEGLRARSVCGLPRFRVPLDDVASVSVVTERSLGGLGGWGIRAFGGRVRIIMGPHTGIRADRRSGGYLLVTVDDAATGAALLEALAARAAITAPAPAGPAGEKDRDGCTN